MTRSIFDPTNPDVERSGSRYLGPDAGDVSHMPSDIVDGKVEGGDKGPDTVPFDANGEPLAPRGKTQEGVVNRK